MNLKLWPLAMAGVTNMKTKVAMAAQFTEITLQDMETFLKRAFRVLKPTQGKQRGEVVFDLFFTPQIGVRVFSSIGQDAYSASGVGTDAIRVLFYNYSKNRPMLTGKAPIVKRTGGWRDNLKDRIEDIMEMFDDKEGYWESRV